MLGIDQRIGRNAKSRVAHSVAYRHTGCIHITRISTEVFRIPYHLTLLVLALRIAANYQHVSVRSIQGHTEFILVPLEDVTLLYTR